MKKIFLLNAILSFIFLVVGICLLESSKVMITIFFGLFLLAVLPIVWSMTCFKMGYRMPQRIGGVLIGVLFLSVCNGILSCFMHYHVIKTNYTWISYTNTALFMSNAISLLVAEQIGNTKFAGRIKVGIFLFLLLVNGMTFALRPEKSAASYPIAYSLYLVAAFIVLPVFLGNVTLIKTKLNNRLNFFLSLIISWIICVIDPLCRLIQYYCGSLIVDGEGVGVLQLLIVAPAVIISIVAAMNVLLFGNLSRWIEKAKGMI